MAIVIRMPEVATGSGEAAIQAWLVEVGDSVSAGQAIAEIETEKAVIEYEAEHPGVLAGVLLHAGEAAPVAAPIAVLATDGETLAEALRAAGVEADAEGPTALAETARAPRGPEATTQVDARPTPLPIPAPDPDVSASGRLFASPLVRKLARDHRIDLRDVKGSGPNGRIVKRDLSAILARATAPVDGAGADDGVGDAADAPQVSASQSAGASAGSVEPDGAWQVPHTGMRRAIARRLLESQTTVPHFSLTADCRVDALLALRAQINEGRELKVSVNDLIVKAVAGAFADVPEANGIWGDESTTRFVHADIAIAVTVPGGLLTPVVRHVDRLSVGELAAQIRDLADRARDGQITQRELEGGSFTVSNLGMFGTSSFSAIINPPHSGILAVGAASPRPVVADDGQLAVATVMTVTLSADHRVLDGALAAQWLAAFVRRVENPLSILV